MRHRGEALRSTIDVPAGSAHDLVLEISDTPLSGPPVDPDIAWTETEATWARSRPRMDRSIASRDSLQAWAVMRGLTAANGAMVAAATMSLPERAEAGRNYDYRYVWIRDQCFAGQAAAKAGAHGLLDGAVRFVSERVCADGPELKPAYTTRGTPVPDEHRVGLPGYPGGSDRAGNHANSQFQLDALGEALLLFGAAAAADRLDVGQWPAVEQAVAAIEKRWQEPDAGIWELLPRQVGPLPARLRRGPASGRAAHGLGSGRRVDGARRHARRRHDRRLPAPDWQVATGAGQPTRRRVPSPVGPARRRADRRPEVEGDPRRGARRPRSRRVRVPLPTR